MEKEKKINEMKQRIRQIHQTYGIDQRELGKILVIVSTSLLIVSIHGALSFQSAVQSLEDSNQKLERASGIINSDNFQNTISRLESMGSPTLTRQIQRASSAFTSASEAIKESKQTQERLERNYKTYQWLTLIAIMGEVAGIAVIYV